MKLREIVYKVYIVSRKSGRAADCVCLENRRPERVRGFESLLFRTFFIYHKLTIKLI